MPAQGTARRLDVARERCLLVAAGEQRVDGSKQADALRRLFHASAVINSTGNREGAYAIDGKEPQVMHGMHKSIEKDTVREGVRPIPLLQLSRRIVVLAREPPIHRLRDNMARLHPRAGDHRAAGPGGVGPRHGARALVQLLDVDVEVGRHDEAHGRLPGGRGSAGVCAGAFFRGVGGRVAGLRGGGAGGEGAGGRDREVGADGVAQDVDGGGATW